jgi:uncharacterized protein
MPRGAAVSAPILIHAATLPAQPWRNGGGHTRELLTWPAGTRDWRLRVSLAQVDRAGPFSAFPGIERWFSVLDGAGVRLSLDGRERSLEPGHEPLNFSGDLPVFCTPVDGPTTDLNLMHAGGHAVMLRAQSGLPWHSNWAHRGLYTRIAGQWHAAGKPPTSLPAHCLLWLEGTGDNGSDWIFSADSASASAPGLWLGFEP